MRTPRTRRLAPLLAGGFSVLALASPPARAQSADVWAPVAQWRAWMEQDRGAPTDYGVQLAPRGVSPRGAVAGLSGTNTASAVKTQGSFAPVIPWPIIPIHAVLMPNGQVLTYGTDLAGGQGAAMVYDVWNPAQGTGASAHTTLPNTTGTDIFCGNQAVTMTGDVLVTGGDLTVNGVRNYAQNRTELFSPGASRIAPAAPMSYPRWYPSLLSLPNGQLVTMGGYQVPAVNNASGQQIVDPVGVPTPEIYTPGAGWMQLASAASNGAFYNYSNWFYPRTFVAPSGQVFSLGHEGSMWSMNLAAGGVTTQVGNTIAGDISLPIAMYAPGKILALRPPNKAIVLDINGATPAVAATAPLSQQRDWANATVLADGQVLVSGGSSVANALTNVATRAEIWNPATGAWTLGAAAAKPRLYHSTALLLPDATVLTGGGGAPGPVNNLNAEIYTPPYLYAANGQLASRPVLFQAPNSVAVGGTLFVNAFSSSGISRITMVRMGSVTHSTNAEQRFVDLPITWSFFGATWATLPANPNVMLPGAWMLFAFDGNGVPSVAAIVQVTASGRQG